MKEVLQFCHDYQNRNGCTRENCNYIHASKEEQNAFLATGQIPRVLAERHAASTAAASDMHTNAETIPQIAMFISESYMSQPPPAPWPPLPPAQSVLPPPSVSAAPPPPPPASPPRHAAGPSVPPAQQLPPPAAVPGVPQLRPVSTPYTAMPQSSSVLFSMHQPAAAVVPEKFDPSKPPPPLPSHIQPCNSGHQKRKIDANGTSATSKIRKPDAPELSDQHCENCVQRELRIDGYKQQMEALHNEEETQILLYKKKLQEYEIGREILKKLVPPALFTVFDNLIEGPLELQLDNSFMSDSLNVSKQALLQLLRFSGASRSVIEPVPSTSHVDDTLQSFIRRQNVASYSTPGQDWVKFVEDILRHNNSTERSQQVEERPSEPSTNRTNGYLPNGQKPQTTRASEPTRYGGAAGYSGPSVQPDFSARPPPAMPAYPVAGPSGYTGPPPAGYPMYHASMPAAPPPNRHYYPQNPAVSGAGGMPYNGTERAAGPGPSHGMQPPATPGALRPPANAQSYNYVARYPQPAYFPPYQ